MLNTPFWQPALRVANNLIMLALAVSLTACPLLGDDENPEPDTTGGVSNALHFSFNTPDWSRNIDCTHLDLPSSWLNEGVYYTSATSQSTLSTFMLSFPADSSDMVEAGNLKRYGITDYTYNQLPFEFSFKVPPTSGSSQRLVSNEGFSDTSYNEIVGITYVGNDGQEAIFQIKGKYQMSMRLAAGTGTDPDKAVSGTYHLKVRTRRN